MIYAITFITNIITFLSLPQIRRDSSKHSYETHRVTRVSYLRIGKRSSSCLNAIWTNIMYISIPSSSGQVGSSHPMSGGFQMLNVVTIRTTE